MPTELNVEILPNDLMQVVESVFGTMMNLDVGECGEPWFHSSDRLTSAVHLAGEWNGALLLECTGRQACRFTGRFLGMDAPDRVDDVVRDVLGELANMIGGNLKCVLTQGIRLSLPSVMNGSSDRIADSGASCRARFAFQCDEGVIWITVVATEA